MTELPLINNPLNNARCTISERKKHVISRHKSSLKPQGRQKQMKHDVLENNISTNNIHSKNMNRIEPILNNGRNTLESSIKEGKRDSIAKHQELLSDIENKIKIQNGHTKYTASFMSPSDRLTVKILPNPFDNPSSKKSALLETVPSNITIFEELEDYCKTHNYSKPIYDLFKLGKANRFNCKVVISGIVYSTYPKDFITEEEAKLHAARRALHELKNNEACHLYPVCVESDFNIALKIYNELKKYPCGVFRNNFPEMFQKTYQCFLRDNWFSIIVSSPKLFSIEESTPGTYILFAQSDLESRPDSSISDTESTSDESMEFPWHLEYWNLYITNPVSTLEIWARIIDENYSKEFVLLSNKIEMTMLTEKQVAQNIKIGNIYLVYEFDCWYRIRVKELEHNRCKCFFIDIGNEDWYLIHQLFVCDARFRKLQPQAIRFGLFGLQDFDKNPYAKPELLNLAERTLIGKVFTKQDEYETNVELSNFDTYIQIVLYDTSSDEDLSLNPLILQNICENSPPPQFEQNSVTQVNITNISCNGDIYCQIQDVGINYIEHLINKLIESKLNQELHRGLYQDNEGSVNQYYIIFDENDKKWYRAIIESFSNVQDEYNLFYIDYGITRVVKTKHILRTNSLSTALHRFPQQAVPVRLHGVHIHENALTRIREFLKPGQLAIIEIVTLGAIPLVNMFIRLELNNILLSINETIRLEQEMSKPSEIFQNRENLKHNICTTSVPNTNPFLCPYRSPQTFGSNSSISKSGGNSSLRSSFESMSSLSDLSSQFQNINLKIRSIPSSELSDLSKIEPPVLPSIGELTYVRVSMALNPSYFAIQPNKDGEKLHQMMIELQNYCTNSQEFIPIDCIRAGEAYSALHVDGYWYRATVKNIITPSMIHVFFFDFGDFTILRSEKLKTLPSQFRKLHQQASKAKLYGIKPKLGKWSKDDCSYFQELTVDKVFAATVRSTVDDEITKEKLIELVLVDVYGEEDILIHELLIKNNLAESC